MTEFKKGETVKTFAQVRDLIIKRGLDSCRKEQQEGIGPDGFYAGSIDAYLEAHKLNSLAELENKIAEMEKEELQVYSVLNAVSMMPARDHDFWYKRGYQLQLDFLWQRLSVVCGRARNVPGAVIQDVVAIMADQRSEVFPKK